MRSSQPFFVVAVLLPLCLILPACGGGGDDDDGGGSSGSAPGVDTPTDDTPASALAAAAGDDRDVVVGTRVTLDGSQSRVDSGRTLDFSWALTARPSSSQAQLDDANTATPEFTADVAGRYTARLAVSDGTGDQSTDEVAVTARAENVNAGPSANAGRDQSVVTGQEVVLDGSASRDPDDDSLGFSWQFASRPSGASETLENADTANPSFTPQASGNYVLSLVVSDGQLNSAADQVTVTVAPAATNSAPVADAGNDQSVSVNTTVQLDASGSSDANGDTLSYGWRIVSRPQGSSASLANPNSVSPSLTTDAVGDYVVELTVSDGQASSTDTGVVSAGPVLELSFDSGDPTDDSPDYEVSDANIFVSNIEISNVPPEAQALQTLRTGRFRLRAIGAAFTVQDLKTSVVRSSTGSQPQLVVQGLNTGDTIAAGQAVDFATIANDVQVPGEYRLDYTFSIPATGRAYRLTFRVDLSKAD